MNATLCLIAALCSVALGCTEGLYHDLDERTANELVVALEEAGIEAHKVDEARRGYAVEVPQGATAEAMNALSSKGLPRPIVDGFATTFPGDSLVPSPSEDRARLQYATAQEVRRSLLAVPGVLDAHINLVLPRADRASVVITWSGAAPPLTEADIRRLVSGGVDGLAPEAVEVFLAESKAPTVRPAKSLVSVGPLTVPLAAKGTTQAVLAGFTAAILLLGLLLITLILRGRGPTRGGL